MRKVISMLFGAFVMLLPAASAQHDAVFWSQQALGLGNDYFVRSLLPLPDDRLAIAGDWLRVPPAPDGASIPINNLFVQLHGADGEIDWNLSVPGSGNTEFAQLAQDPSSGDLFAVGRSWPREGVTDVLVVRISERGRLVWQREFREPGTQQAAAVATVPGEGVFVAGMTIPLADGPGNPEGLLLRLDSEGNELWRFQTESVDHTSFTAVVAHDDGSVTVAGIVHSALAGEHAGLSDILLITLDESGDVLWQTQFGSYGDDAPVRLLSTEAGETVVLGHSFSRAGALDVLVARFSSEGDELQNFTFGGNDNDRALAVRLDDEGGLHVAAVLARYTSANGPTVKSVALVQLVDSEIVPVAPELSFDGAIGGAVILLTGDSSSLLFSVNAGPGWRLLSLPPPLSIPSAGPG